MVIILLMYILSSKGPLVGFVSTLTINNTFLHNLIRLEIKYLKIITRMTIKS